MAPMLVLHRPVQAKLLLGHWVMHACSQAPPVTPRATSSLDLDVLSRRGQAQCWVDRVDLSQGGGEPLNQPRGCGGAGSPQSMLGLQSRSLAHRTKSAFGTGSLTIKRRTASGWDAKGPVEGGSIIGFLLIIL